MEGRNNIEIREISWREENAIKMGMNFAPRSVRPQDRVRINE